MSGIENINPQGSSEATPKPYDQRPGEPDKWYDHFFRYCKMGPSRSLDRCYRQVTTRWDDLPDPPGSGTIRAPGAWKRNSTEFDWARRASAWDADQRQRNLERQEETLDLFSVAARESLQYLLDTVHGQVIEPDGAITSISDHYERRMAAKTIFHKWTEVLAMLRENPEEGTGEVKITEILVHKSGSAQGKSDPEKKLAGK